MGIREVRLDPAASRLLEAYAWPGNARELRNVMERALILSSGEEIVPDCLPREIIAQAPRADIGESAFLSLETLEMSHIRRVLGICKGNKSEAARRLGITRLTLRNKVKQYDLAEFADNQPSDTE